MVYGCAYWSLEVDESIPKGFRDSKQMKDEGKFKTIAELRVVTIAYCDANDSFTCDLLIS